jgi:hypothetical protein
MFRETFSRLVISSISYLGYSLQHGKQPACIDIQDTKRWRCKLPLVGTNWQATAAASHTTGNYSRIGCMQIEKLI